jgi:hypothetical protein
MRLSECWDKIKSEEKERKKERAQQKAVFKQNVDIAQQKLLEFNTAFQEQKYNPHEALRKLEEVITEIRALDLGRDEQRMLREEVQNARKPINEKIHAEEHARLNQDAEREKQRRQTVNDIKTEISDLLKTSEDAELDPLVAKRDALMEKIGSIQLSKAEKQDFERHLKPLRDIISEKKENSLLSLSDDDRQSIQQLREVLRQKKERRQEIKDQIDVLRKVGGASGLDFEQAMNYNTQLAEEKERLEKINAGIKEIEDKIRKLQTR